MQWEVAQCWSVLGCGSQILSESKAVVFGELLCALPSSLGEGDDGGLHPLRIQLIEDLDLGFAYGHSFESL